MTFEPNRPAARPRDPAIPVDDAGLPQADPFIGRAAGRPADPVPAAGRTVDPLNDPAAPAAVRNPTEARQGATTGRMRWVLGVGIVAVAILFVIAYLLSVP